MASIPIKKRILTLAQCSSAESFLPFEESINRSVCSAADPTLVKEASHKSKDSVMPSSLPCSEFIDESISKKVHDERGGQVYNSNNQQLLLGTSSYGTSNAASGAGELLVDVKPGVEAIASQPLFGKLDPSEKSAIRRISGFHEPQGTSSENYGPSWIRQSTETCESLPSAGGLLGLAVNSCRDHSRVAVKSEIQDGYRQGQVLNEQRNLRQFNQTDPCTETDSPHERVSWDLNTTMDTWEGSMSETSSNYKTHLCLRQPIVHEGNQETGTVLLFPMKADEIGLESGVKSVTMSACNSILSKSNLYSREEYCSGTSLDLQLKQPRPEIKLSWDAVSCCSDKVIGGGETSDLSLSLASNLVPNASGVVGSDPNAARARKDAVNISEETPISACSPSNSRLEPSCNRGSSCDMAIKSEPHEGPLQDCSGALPDKKSRFPGMVSCFIDPCGAQVSEEAGGSMSGAHCSIPEIPKVANASPPVHRDVADDMNPLSESTSATAVKSERHEVGETSECKTVVVPTFIDATDNAVDSANTIRKAANVTNSCRAEGHTDNCQDKKVISSGAEHSVAGSSGHDKKIAPDVTEGASEAGMGSPVGSLAPRYKQTAVAESNRVHFEGKLESSADALEVPLGKELEMDTSHGVCGVRNVVHRHGHDDYEDGELRDTLSVSKNGREQIRVCNGTEPFPPEGVTIPNHPDKGAAFTPLQHAPKPKLGGDAEVGIHVKDSGVRISSNAGDSTALLSTSGSSRKARSRKETGQEDRCPDAKSELENAHARVVKGKQVSAYLHGSDLPGDEHMVRKVSAESGHMANHESKREKRSMDTKPRSACEEPSTRRPKSDSARSRSGQFGLDRAPDKFLRRREHRYGGYNDRFKKFRGYKNQDRCF